MQHLIGEEGLFLGGPARGQYPVSLSDKYALEAQAINNVCGFARVQAPPLEYQNAREIFLGEFWNLRS